MPATAIAQSFTVEQSSAISSVQVENSEAVISYRSNPEKFYTYECSDNFVQELESILSQNPIQGLGSFVSAARKTGDLREVTV